MDSIDDLTRELCKAFEAVRDDKAYVAQASELANIAGKIINAQKLTLDYAVARGENPELDFLSKIKK